MSIEVVKRSPQPATIKRLLDMLRMGATLTDAGYVMGARPTTLRRWLSEDPLLRQEVSDAQDEAKTRLGRGKADIDFAAPVREAYLEMLAQGTTRKAAANLCGISEAAMNHFLRNDEEFKAEVEHAEAEAEEFFLGRLRSDAEKAPVGKGWIPALEWLKRRRGSIYGDATRLETIQNFDDIKRMQEELAAEDIHIPIDQILHDFQALQVGHRGRPRKLKALPTVVDADSA